MRSHFLFGERGASNREGGNFHADRRSSIARIDEMVKDESADQEQSYQFVDEWQLLCRIPVFAVVSPR
jgi:hypothetical protein